MALSAFKAAEDRDNLVLRIFNPGASAVSGSVRLGVPVSRLWEIDLNQGCIRELELDPGGILPLDVPSGKIISVELE